MPPKFSIAVALSSGAVSSFGRFMRFFFLIRYRQACICAVYLAAGFRKVLYD